MSTALLIFLGVVCVISFILWRMPEKKEPEERWRGKEYFAVFLVLAFGADARANDTALGQAVVASAKCIETGIQSKSLVTRVATITAGCNAVLKQIVLLEAIKKAESRDIASIVAQFGKKPRHWDTMVRSLALTYTGYKLGDSLIGATAGIAQSGIAREAQVVNPVIVDPVVIK